MKTRVQIALLGALLSVAIHFYLTWHYYALKFGFASGQSICNLSAKFDCDAVAASAYAAFLGVPMALWGAALNLVLFGVMMIAWLEWTEQPERWRRWTVLLTGLNLLASVVMGAISLLFLVNLCPFCMVLYALSLIIFLAYQGVPREPFWSGLTDDLSNLTGEGKGLVIALGLVPLIAVLGHQMAVVNMTGDESGHSAELDRVVQQSIQRWTDEKVQEFVAKPSMAMGATPETAKLTLVEFADFRCGHCKHASYTLDAFVKSHPDVRFEFYAFPLDGACNEKIKEPNGLSCRLAETVYCAEKESHKGWEMHHALYAAQDRVNQLASVNDLDLLLSKEVGELGLNWESVLRCVNDGGTIDSIRAQAKQGGLVNVQGTPTIFANGRQLEGGQLLPVLEAVHAQSQAKH